MANEKIVSKAYFPPTLKLNIVPYWAIKDSIFHKDKIKITTAVGHHHKEKSKCVEAVVITGGHVTSVARRRVTGLVSMKGIDMEVGVQIISGGQVLEMAHSVVIHPIRQLIVPGHPESSATSSTLSSSPIPRVVGE
nr:hypothetical protein [Tanacetum cinerariifolium]